MSPSQPLSSARASASPGSSVATAPRRATTSRAASEIVSTWIAAIEATSWDRSASRRAVIRRARYGAWKS